jgi:hypothetical protein
MTSTTQPIHLAQHLCCTNDTNGNPRRIWVGYSASGQILDIRDEGYDSRPEYLRDGSAFELPAIAIPPAEYREWLERLEHRTGRYAVVEPAHVNAQDIQQPDWTWARFYSRARARRWMAGHYAADRMTIRDTRA